MSEYIVDVPDREADLFIARFGIEGTKLLGYRLRGEVVRCADCAWFRNNPLYGAYCTNFGAPLHGDYDGYCAWSIRKEVRNG